MRLRTIILCLCLLPVAPACDDDGPPPQWPVSILVGGELPAGGQVGTYTVVFDEGWLALGNLTIFGERLGQQVNAHLLKHTGHGGPEFFVELNNVVAVDLIGNASELAEAPLFEGLYYDGQITLVRASTETLLYEAGTPSSMPAGHAVLDHTLYLSGTATDAAGTYTFEIIIDSDSIVPGILYQGSVFETGAIAITTRLDLGALLADIDFAALADPTGHVSIDPVALGDEYLLVKARLQTADVYLHEELEP